MGRAEDDYVREMEMLLHHTVDSLKNEREQRAKENAQAVKDRAMFMDMIAQLHRDNAAIAMQVCSMFAQRTPQAADEPPIST